MATLTNEQIEQKKQLIVEKMKQMKAIYDELVEAGAIELSEDELDQIAGGGKISEAMDKGAAWRLVHYLSTKTTSTRPQVDSLADQKY